MGEDRLVVLGCGYVGLELGRQLRDDYQVKGIRRSEEGLASVRAAGFEAVRADLTDPEDRAALPDADVVVFAASSGGNASAREIYNGALEGVIDSYGSRETPPDRFVYTSSTGVYGDHEGDWVDESTTIYPDTDRQRVLLEAERLALEAAGDHGMDGTVVRFGGLYGPGRYRLERYLEGPVTEGYLNLVHREDAAGAVAFLLDAGAARDEVVLAVDEEPLDKWTFADWLAAECGVDSPPKETIEDRLAEEPDPARAHRIRANKRCSSRKLRSLGYDFAFPTAREGYRPAIQAYRESHGAE
jgi:nucleoside-diphosphate-sugar epimerase